MAGASVPPGERIFTEPDYPLEQKGYRGCAATIKEKGVEHGVVHVRRVVRTI